MKPEELTVAGTPRDLLPCSVEASITSAGKPSVTVKVYHGPTDADAQAADEEAADRVLAVYRDLTARLGGS